jgi:hypothetical protein
MVCRFPNRRLFALWRRLRPMWPRLSELLSGGRRAAAYCALGQDFRSEFSSRTVRQFRAVLIVLSLESK